MTQPGIRFIALKHIQKSNSSGDILITACSDHSLSTVADMLFSFQTYAHSSQAPEVTCKA